MATFTPDLPDVQGPNYFSYSKGTDGLAVDQSMGNLFKGIGEVATGAAEATDKALQVQIKKDVYEGADKLRTQFGNDSAVQKEQELPFDIRSRAQAGSMPEDLRGLGGKLERLQQAKNAGKLENSDYWAAAESYVREMRARYPGYRDIIDRDTSQVLGNTPANALHESLMSDLQKNQSTAQHQRDQYLSFIKENAGYLPADTMARLEQGTPYTMSALYAEVSQRKGAKMASEAVTATIAAKKAAGEDVERESTRAITNTFGLTVQNTIKSMGEVAGFKNYNDFQTWINNFNKTGTGMGANDIARATAYFNNLEITLNQAMDAQASMNLSKDPGQFTSFNSILTPQVINERKGQAMSYFVGMKNAVLSGNMSMAAYYNNLSQNIEHQSVATALQNPKLNEMHTVLKVGGNEVVPIWLRQPGNLSNLNTALLQIGMNKSAVGGYKSTTEVLNEAKKQQADSAGDNKDPAPFNALIDNRIAGITDPKTLPQFKGNLINEMFGPENADFLKNFSDTPKAPRGQLYSKLTSPAMTDAVYEHSKTDGGASWNKYMNWSARNLAANFQTDAATLQAAIVSRPDLSITWDQENRQFVMGSSGIRTTGSPYADAGLSYLNSGAKTAMDNINMQFKSMDYILKKGGYNSGQEFQKLFTMMGIDTGAKQEPGIASGLAQGLRKTGESFSGASGRASNPLPFQSERDPVSEAPATQAIRDVIQGGESKSSGGYDAWVGEKAGSNPLAPTRMTVNEVLNAQKERISQGKNTAVGAYQITNSTLKGLKKTMGLNGDEPFTSDLQDQMFHYLAEQRGLSAFKNDKIDEATFARNLSQEWAALPSDARGKSFYEGIGTNRANVKYNDLIDAIRKYKQFDVAGQ